MTQQPDYALRISENERARYRMMAQRALEQESGRWAAAGVVPGARVADVGCGPGAVLVHLGTIVGRHGEVVGVEPDAASRAAAEDEIALAGLGNARVVEGTGTATGLPEASFDAVMVRHVLFHTGRDAPDVVRHCASLLEPGGHLYLADTDAEAMRVSIADPDPDATEAMERYRAFQSSRGCDISIGPRLGSLLIDAGLEITERSAWYNVIPGQFIALGGPMVAAIPAMLAAGAATESDAARWRAGVERVAAVPGVVFFAPTFVAAGRKPG